MAYRAYVGNLPFSFAKTDLANLFAEFGSVKSAEIILDRETGRSRGFGFVELETAEQLKAAIDALNGKPVASRSLTVTEAREREARGRAVRARVDRVDSDRARRAISERLGPVRRLRVGRRARSPTAGLRPVPVPVAPSRSAKPIALPSAAAAWTTTIATTRAGDVARTTVGRACPARGSVIP